MGVLIHLCLIYLTTICDHYPQYTSWWPRPASHYAKGVPMKKEVKVDLWLLICIENHQKSLRTFRQHWIFDFVNIGGSTSIVLVIINRHDLWILNFCGVKYWSLLQINCGQTCGQNGLKFHQEGVKGLISRSGNVHDWMSRETQLKLNFSMW